MKKVISLVILCSMILQSVGNTFAAGEFADEDAVNYTEEITSSDNAIDSDKEVDSDNGKISEEIEMTEDASATYDEVDETNPDKTAEAEGAANSSLPEDPQSTIKPQEEIPSAEPEMHCDENAGTAVFDMPAVNLAAGSGNYEFNNAAEVSDWTSVYAKISWDGSKDANENGGGSVKFEYDLKSGASGDNIKMTIPAQKFYDNLSDGECYTVQFKILGERVKSGADVYLNVTTTDQYKNVYYPIASAMSDRVKIEKDVWKTITLDYIHNPTTGNFEIVLPSGLSKQNDDVNYDIYYIDDVKIIKNDTIAPYAEKAKWYDAYKGNSNLLVDAAEIDISETSSIMQAGDKQNIVLYEVSGSAGQTAADIVRTKSEPDGYKFTSAYPEIAEIDANGIITAKSGGYTVITAATGSGANEKTAQLLLTVVDDVNKKSNYIVETPNNYMGRVEDFTGMRDYVYMTFCGRTSDENSYPAVSMNVTTPHVASFMLYDTGTNDIEMDIQYGKLSNRLFEGGGSNQYYNTGYRWLQVPGVDSWVSGKRKAGWHQVSIVIDYPTEHSVADGYMSKTIFIDGRRIGSGDFDCTAYSGNLSFWFRKNQLVKEAYVVRCGTDFNIKNMTPNLNSGKLSDVNSCFTFEFTNNINPKTVEGNILLSDEIQNINFDYETAANKLIITPEYPFDTERTYSLTLKKEMAALAKGASVPGTLDTERKFVFSTNEYPISYNVDTIRLNKMRITFLNNSNESKEVYYVISAYKNKAASVNVYEGSLAAGGTSTITATLNVDKISNCDGYDIFVFERENGKSGAVLNSVSNNSFAGITESTDIVPKDVTNILAGYDPEKQLVEITGQSKTKRAELPVILKMYNKDAGESADAYSRFEVIRTGKNGEINYKFAMPDNSEKGLYKIVLSMPFETVPYEREINFMDINDAKAYLAQIDSAATAAEVAATDIFNTDIDPLRILDDDFINLQNKDFIYNSILQNKPYASRNDGGVSYFKAVYNAAAKIESALEGTAANCVKEIKENHSDGYWGIAENNAYKAFTENFSEQQQGKVIEKLKGAKGFKDIGDIFNTSVIIEDVLSQSSYSTVYAAVANYNEIHNIDYSTYNGLTDGQKLTAAENFYKSVGSIETIAQLKETFEKCASDAAKQGQGNTGGNTGGSSGGSGGGGAGVSIKTGENAGKFPEWYVDESQAANAKIFDDLGSVEWAEYSINKLYNLGAISGKADRIFAPQDAITREELCRIVTLAFKLSGKETAEPMPFDDVEQGKWYTDFVEICYQNGVISGIDNNMFGVGRTVTREEISAILVRAAEAAGKTLDYYFTIFPFTDADQISDWAKNSVSILRECLIVSGMEDGRFAPKENVTRAQAAKMIAGLLDYNY